ncbi:hypothetical protein R3X27_03200 [Tropicimonas sp. TH_r6]|uniref:hypothetical protein n=1 Tax=Tropicimonas sp. TH_r6 TaxID=3082085 RepID=UPI002954D380|nr:hypothetical protein [Tropicimonas sp. TH_r6]MDV7141683.1 hypothetical protein [Tropicimonas sp. TH_r6]
MISEVKLARLQRLWRVIRRVVLGVVFAVLALTVLVTVIGTWRGQASRAELLGEDTVHVVPHLLRYTYIGDARFEAVCRTIEACDAAAQEICGDAVVRLEENRDADGIWLLLAECEEGISPAWSNGQ